jgi:hypothetical protein
LSCRDEYRLYGRIYRYFHYPACTLKPTPLQTSLQTIPEDHICMRYSCNPIAGISDTLCNDISEPHSSVFQLSCKWMDNIYNSFQQII